MLKTVRISRFERYPWPKWLWIQRIIKENAWKKASGINETRKTPHLILNGLKRGNSIEIKRRTKMRFRAWNNDLKQLTQRINQDTWRIIKEH